MLWIVRSFLRLVSDCVLHKCDQLTRMMLLTVCFMLIISCLPAFEIKAIFPSPLSFRKMDLFSDLRYSDTINNSKALELAIDSITDHKASPAHDFSGNNVSDSEALSSSIKAEYDNFCKHLTKSPVYFEDYTNSDAVKRLANGFCRAQQGKRSIRIAFLGDSFIESDILTADIRALLQSFYGGNGVGFVPMASIASKYRKTVTHNFAGWKSYSMVQYKQADWKKLILSGYYFEPEEGASVSMELSSGAEKFKPVSTAKLLFLNQHTTQIDAHVNKSKTMKFSPKASNNLQTLDIKGNISSLSMNFKSTSGFTAYGIYMNDATGVYVDNYSVRGSSGIVLSAADRNLCRDLDSIMPYDLIVLQYGLNVASASITNYTYYQKKMIDVVKQLKGYFPKSTFLIMGVGDRAMKSTAGFETMPGIIAMVEVQRNIAKKSQSLFWDTYTAMGGRNSMSSFVQHSPPLASKDYTHINHAGGRIIAKSFVYALMKEIESNLPKHEARVSTKPASNAKK